VISQDGFSVPASGIPPRIRITTIFHRNNGNYIFLAVCIIYLEIIKRGYHVTIPQTDPKETGSLTWAARWSDLKQKHLCSANISHEGDFWMNPENIRRYLENTRGQYGTQVASQLQRMEIRPGSRVLDIGGGAGALAVPLSKQGCAVTVVEQSRLMADICEEYRVSEQANQISYVIRRWEDVTPDELKGPFDAVIASYSLTMTDIATAIRTMQAVSSGRIFLFWFLTPPSWAGVMQDLWPLLHKKPYYISPLADCLWNVLYEMGIYADVEVMDPAPPRFFDSLDEAVAHLAGRLECRENWQNDIVRSYLMEKLVTAPDGRLQYNEGHRSAKIWWDNSLRD
jgi:SAM-dependent methyltransferase